MKSNRMRNIHSYLVSEYGKESVENYKRWEKYEYKMADFQNHRHFSVRCLSKDVIPTSVRLKSNIRTPKAKYIIRMGERALLNERIRSINKYHHIQIAERYMYKSIRVHTRQGNYGGM